MKNSGIKNWVILIIVCTILAYLGGDFLISEEELLGENVEGTMEIHYLDVGQGDSTYIKMGDFDMLIDAGPTSEVNHLLKQLSALKI